MSDKQPVYSVWARLRQATAERRMHGVDRASILKFFDGLSMGRGWSKILMVDDRVVLTITYMGDYEGELPTRGEAFEGFDFTIPERPSFEDATEVRGDPFKDMSERRKELYHDPSLLNKKP